MENIKKKDGFFVDFSSCSDLAELFLQMVEKDAVRSILFDIRNDREITKDNIVRELGGYSIIKVMKRALNLAYVIALCRWKQLKDDKNWGYDDDLNYFENSRFTKLFQSALSGEDITLDLQIFSLMELWVDLKSAPSLVSNQFKMIFDTSKIGDAIGLTLQAVRDTLKNVTFKTNDNKTKYTTEYCNYLCYRLLRSFMVFRRVEINYPADNRLDDSCDFSISYELDYSEQVTLNPNTLFNDCKFVVTEQQLKLLSGDNNVSAPKKVYLYMLTEFSAFDGKLQHRYSSFDGEREALIQSDLSTVEPKSESYMKDIYETRKFLSFSYRNIREFAMIINDAIKNSTGKKEELFGICRKKYPKIIAGIKNIDAPNIYWDNIITLMLLEMGVSDFLEYILCEETMFNVILENIAWRYKGRNALAELRSDYSNSVRLIESQRGVSSESLDKLRLELRIKTVLKAMNFNTEEDDSQNPFLDSLSYKYGNICTCIKTLKTPGVSFDTTASCAAELQKIFSDIFMFLQVFYVGLDAYAKVDMEMREKGEIYTFSPVTIDESKDETEAEEEDNIRKQRREGRKKLYDAFVAAGQERLNIIKAHNLTQLFDGFCELCAKYNTFSHSSQFSISDEAKRLKHIITRNYICDAQKLRRFASVETAFGEKTTIFNVLDNLQKYGKDPSYYDWLTYLQDIFMFLIYNEDYNERGLINRLTEPLQDKDCDPIYPYIVTYYKENIDRDNVKKCTYRVPLPTSKDENSGYVVTLLTDAEYLPSTYYCIPLRYGSSDSWWINPFLIPKRVIRRIKYPEERKKARG